MIIASFLHGPTRSRLRRRCIPYRAIRAFGTRPIVQVRGAGKDRRGYLKFDLGQIPAAHVVRAELMVYASYISGGATVPVTVTAVEDDQWTESGLTWNRAPVPGDTLDQLNVSRKGYYAFDVTAFVHAELGADQMVSLALFDAQERNELVNFWSREAVRNHPELIVTYAADTAPPVQNKPPVAMMTVSLEAGNAPLTVTFDGLASTDEEGQDLTFDWDFGDGHTASGEVVLHTYEDEGAYTARLIVTDDAGVSAMADTLITVRAAADFVANGSFEERDEAGMPYDWRLGATGAWQVVDTAVSAGVHSLALRDANVSLRTPIASAMTVTLLPGVYTLSADLATDRLGTQDGRRRGVRISLKDESIQTGSGVIASTEVVRGTRDWQRLSQRVVIEREGDYTVRIEAYNKPNGRAWIDAVSLIKE